MIKVTSFAKAKENSKGSNTSTGYANSSNVTVNKTGVDGVNIWGQWHDHTADVEGDMSNVGNINATGNIITTADIQGRNLTTKNKITANGGIVSNGDVTIDGNLEVGGNGDFDGDISATNGTFSNLVKTQNAEVGQTLTTMDFEAEDANITNMFGTNATIGNLTITKAAHFYQLIIDQIKSTQGQIIITPANATIVAVDYASDDGGQYALYFLARDEETGKEIGNSFEVDDQILCQTFNAATGTSYSVDNKFYWAKIIAVSATPNKKVINGVGKDCHYVIVGWTDKDKNSNAVPQVGDEIVMLGNRTNTERQNAITIGAYNNPYLDAELKAPFIVQYAGINDYNLSSHRVNVISNGYNFFNGTFTTSTGDNIEDLINDMAEGAMTYVHTAYANNDTGTLNFSKTYFEGAIYIGFCSNHNQSDSNLNSSSYEWVRIKGEDGGTSEQYKLIPIQEQAPIDKNGTVGLNLKYNILHIVGATYENVTATANKYDVFFMGTYNGGYGGIAPITQTYIQCSTNTKTPSYSKAEFQTNYNNRTDKLLSLDVVLADFNPSLNKMSPDGSAKTATIFDRRILYPAMLPSATFEITDEIKSTVQGHTDRLDGIDNSISTIEQKADTIQSTVNTNTTQISNLDGRITTNTNNISTLTQKANSIEATVTSHTTQINNDKNGIATNKTDIANLKITANEIKSSVQSIHGSTKNLFNFSYCKWDNTIPFIQGYGIEGIAATARISNLGFDGVGGDFAVSCDMMMSNTSATINVNLCDYQAEDNKSNQTVTTKWKNHTFVFKNVQRYIGGTSETNTSYNGFIDFEGASSTNKVYVKNLMIVRGNVPMDWGVSEKDIQAFKDSENLVADWFLQDMTQTTTYKGYNVYKNTKSPNCQEGQECLYDYILKNDLVLEQNTPYTLSFYACSPDDAVLASYLYGNGGCVNGSTAVNDYTNIEIYSSSVRNQADGLTYTRIGYDWKHYVIHWYNQNAGKRNCIVARLRTDWKQDDIADFYICGMELRKGYWTDEQADSNSLIRQTANEIELKVKDTGINIGDGTITLNADNTTINGNLNLRDSKQGLIIYDNYGNPKISVQNETVGTLENFDFGTDKLFKSSTSSIVNSLTYSVTLPTITLGYYNQGQNLEIHNVRVNTYNRQRPFDTDISKVRYTYTIKCGSTTIGSKTGIAAKDRFDYKMDDYTNSNLTNTGTYTIEITINVTLTNSYIFGPFGHFASLYCRVIQTNINKIATDGAVFASSINKFNWFGSDQMLLRNGNSAIRLKDGKLQRNMFATDEDYYDSRFSDISSTMPYAYIKDITYTATVDDSLIIFGKSFSSSNETHTLYLPKPSTCPGKVYYVRNIDTSSTRVYVSGASSNLNYFLPEDSNSETNNISIGNKSCMIISCSFFWVLFYCG